MCEGQANSPLCWCEFSSTPSRIWIYFFVCFVQIADGGGVLISQKLVFLESRCKECADDLPCQQISLELCAPMFHRQRAAYARIVTNFTPKYIYMCTCAESMPESASRPFQEHHQLPPSSLWTCISPLHAVNFTQRYFSIMSAYCNVLLSMEFNLKIIFSVNKCVQSKRIL